MAVVVIALGMAVVFLAMAFIAFAVVVVMIVTSVTVHGRVLVCALKSDGYMLLQKRTRNVEHVKHWYLCQRWRAVRWCACAASERMGRDRCDALRGAEAARLLRGAWMLPQILPSQVCERPAPARRPRESSTRGAGPGPLPGAVVGNPVKS